MVDSMNPSRATLGLALAGNAALGGNGALAAEPPHHAGAA
jgi:hypothetical protein